MVKHVHGRLTTIVKPDLTAAPILLRSLLITILVGALLGAATPSHAQNWTATWTQKGYPGPDARAWDRLTYDPLNRSIVLMAGSGGGYNNDVWWYDAASDLWTQIEPDVLYVNAFVPPCPRDEIAIEYDPVNQLYWMFGGSGFACVGPILTAGAGSTTMTLVDPTLPATTVDAYKDWNVRGVDLYASFAYVSAYDPVSKTLTLSSPFDGLAPGVRYYLAAQPAGGGTWYYSPVTHTWGGFDGPHWGYDGPSPVSRLSPSLAYSSVARALVMFGGQGLNDTWALDLLTKTWVQQIPVGSPSSPWYRAQIENAMVYDSADDVFILFGGCNCTGDGGPSLGDTWVYQLSTNTWTEMTPAVSPPPRQGHTLVYDSTNKVAILFGGFDAPSQTFFNDLWVYQYATNTWTQVFPSVSPPERRAGAMAYDPVNQVSVLYAGKDWEGTVRDVWQLKLAAAGGSNPVPSLTSISPNSTAAGGPSFTLTVTGANFVPSSVVHWNGTARPTTYVKNTQLQASIPAGDIASPGSPNITVFTPSPGGGTSSGLTLTVTAPPPTPTAITPPQGAPGATVPVTITGTGFAAGATVSVSGTGITVSNVTVLSATQLTATLTIASGAAPGARDVTVTNPDGGTGTLAGGFTVASLGPATLTLVYNGLLRDRVGQGNTALGPDGALDGTLTATLSAPGGRTVTALRLDSTAPGTWDTDSGTPFWVLGVAPTLDGAVLNNPGSMAVNFPVADGGSFVVFASDYLGGEFLPGRTLTLTATFADGSTATAVTTVTSSAPILTSITPPQGAPGATVPVTITGTGFAAGATVSLSGTGITVSNVAVLSATQLTATLTIASGAAPGARDVTVTNPDGGTGKLAGGFTVASLGPATLSLVYNGKLRDRVGQGPAALGPDGALDGTLTATLSAPGGRTVTALRLDSTAPGTWDTDSGSPFWVLAVAPTLDGTVLNDPGSMAVNFPVADGGSFVVFASDLLAGEFLPGRTLTLIATFADGSTATAVTTVPSATLSLAFNGLLRDRVGQGDTALGSDGALDGTLTATLSASGGRTVTALRLDSTAPGTWDTDSGTPFWVLAVAPALDGAVLNDPGTMAVNFPVADGGSFVVFASDYLAGEFLPGRTLTLTATFADGSTATAVTTVPSATLSLAFNGLLRDRVGQGPAALGPDGALDGTFTVTLNASGGRTVTALRLDSTAPGTWDTDDGSPFWVLAVAPTLDGAVLNDPGTMAVNFPVADGGSFVVFASDLLAGEFLPGRTLTLIATFADGSTATAVSTVP